MKLYFHWQRQQSITLRNWGQRSTETFSCRFAVLSLAVRTMHCFRINPLKPELNSICYLLALLGAHNFLHVSRIRVELLTFR